MRYRLLLLALLGTLLAPTAAWSQAAVYMCIELTTGIDRCQHVSVANPLPVTGTLTPASGGATGSAVPASADYVGINVAGTLRGWSGLATGSIFPGTVAIVDASGAQITSFGGAASENHIGEVGGNILPITNAMTTTNATVTTGQSIGGLQTLANAVRVSGSLGASGTSGMVQTVLVTFKDAVATSQIDVFFFNASPSGSTCTNAAAFILVDADRDKMVGVAHVTDFTDGNTAVVAQAMNQAMPFGLASATSLFACVVARGSFAITGTANASLGVRVLRN